MGKVYGYVRVSSKDQNVARQLAALEKFHLERKSIFIDKMSGKDFNRPSYMRMIRRLREGDLIIIKSIDRLGRNYDEIIEQWRLITKDKKADIRVLDMPLLDTTLSKDILGTFIADLVLQVLSFCAHEERTNIKQKRGELFLEDSHYLCQMISNMLLMPLIKKNSVKEKRLHTYILVAQVFINTRKNIVNDILFLPS